ncbi:MAG: SDR family oxidoreductase [Chitinispirillaceae bacterium]
MSSKILVTGATGALGRLVLKYLVHKNCTAVRAGVHRQERAEYVKMSGVQTVPLDFGDFASIDRALEGIQTLFLLTPTVREQVEFTRRMVDRCRLWGVERIVKLSIFGADSLPGTQITRWHNRSEAYIQDSGIPFTFVRPNAMMQNFVRQVQPAGSFLYFPLGQSRISFVDSRDVAAFCAEVISSSESQGPILNLTGPSALTMEEVAQAITDVVGHHIGYIDTPEDTFAHFLESTGTQQWLANALAELYSLWREGEFDVTVTSDFERMMGRKPFSFRKFCTDYAAIFRAIIQQEHHTNMR